MSQPHKRHVRMAIVETLATGSTDLPPEVTDTWQVLKEYIGGHSDKSPAPTKRQLQQVYEMVLGYQVFIAGAFRVVSIPLPESGQPQAEADPVPLIVLP